MTVDDLVGRRRFQDLLAVGSRIYHDTHFSPLLKLQEAVSQLAFELRRDDGTTIPVLLNAAVQRAPDGAERIWLTILDASDRRQYEQELLGARRRAEASERRAAFLVAVGVALDETPNLEERAQRLADALVPAVARAATIELGVLGHEGTILTAGEPPADGTARVVRLRRGERAFGTITLHGEPADDRLVMDDPLSEALAYLASLALDNAALYERVHDTALVLQRSLLAAPAPDDPRFSVESRYVPSVSSLAVGGDWHDVFHLRSGRLALLVGDVVGHGIEAAAAMGQLRSAVRALAMDDAGPSVLLERLDAFVVDTGVGYMATIAYAEVDADAGVGAYACAGHPPPLLQRRALPSRLLWEGRSTPLGVRRGCEPRPSGVFEFTSQDRLILYTDGLIEERGRPLDDGFEALLRVTSLGTSSRVDDLADQMQALLGPDGRRDDVCFTIVERI